MTDLSGEPPQIRRLKAVLHGIEGLSAPASCAVLVGGTHVGPPPYVVKLVLLVAGFQWFQSEEKSAWQVYVTYAGFNFRLRDWKRSSWTISVDSDEPAAAVAGQTLVRKIGSAAKLLDSVLSTVFSERIANDEFYLNNSYLKIRTAYDYFREAALTDPPAPSDAEKGGDVGWLTAGMAWQVKRDRTTAHNGYAAAGLYYASLEILFDVMFAFGPRTIAFADFKQMEWRKRFLHVMPVRSDAVLARLYKGLLRFKRELRDPVFHGLGGSESCLVEGPAGVGLIPVSYEPLESSVTFTMAIQDADKCRAALATFDSFDKWVAAQPPANFAVEFARSGFAVPFQARQVAEVVSKMTDIDSFRTWLLDEARAEDEFLERW